MTKKEQAQMEEALTASALRSTSPVEPDLQPPESYAKEHAVLGWLPFGGGSSQRVEQAWTTAGSHGTGRLKIGQTINSQNCCWLFSSRLAALKQTRYLAEQAAARQLRAIDRQIEDEIANPRALEL